MIREQAEEPERISTPSPKRQLEPRHEKDIDTAMMPEPVKSPPAENSIASRMALFENRGTSKGTGSRSSSPSSARFQRSVSTASSTSPADSPKLERMSSLNTYSSPGKERSTSTSSTGSDKDGTSERTINRHGREVFRINLSHQRQNSLPPEVEDVRTNGDGKEVPEISPFSKEHKMPPRREFLTSKDMGKSSEIGQEQVRIKSNFLGW